MSFFELSGLGLTEMVGPGVKFWHPTTRRERDVLPPVVVISDLLNFEIKIKNRNFYLKDFSPPFH